MKASREMLHLNISGYDTSRKREYEKSEKKNNGWDKAEEIMSHVRKVMPSKEI